MTPKEKAEELINKYDAVANQSKECALICVDEILLELKYCSDVGDEIVYWQKVKKEIEKL